MASLIGLSILTAIMFFSEPLGDDPTDIFSALVAMSFALPFAAIGATFVTAAMLGVIGLPIALVLGTRIVRPWALGLALIVAAIACEIPSQLFDFGPPGEPWKPGWPYLIFALPAAYFYRRCVIDGLESREI